MREAARVARGGAAGVPEARGVPGMPPVVSAAISGAIQALKSRIHLISNLHSFFTKKELYFRLEINDGASHKGMPNNRNEYINTVYSLHSIHRNFNRS